MSRIISVFPMLNENLLEEISPTNNDAFYAKENDNNLKLQIGSTIDNPHINILVDEENKPWSLKSGDLFIKRTINMNKVNSLFGVDGIVCKDSVLGVGLRWYSVASHQRFFLEIGEIKDSLLDFSVTKEIHIERSSLIGTLVIETVLYIKQSGKVQLGEEHFANKPGIVLGEFNFTEIRLDGAGSEFPIFYDENQTADDPLWSVYIDWEDPAEDSFLDCFQIFINTNNRNYCYVKSDSEKFDPHLMDEIVSSALTLMILKLKGCGTTPSVDWERMEKCNNLEDGSVSQLVYYYLNVKKLDFSTPSTTLESFRIAFEKAGRE